MCKVKRLNTLYTLPIFTHTADYISSVAHHAAARTNSTFVQIRDEFPPIFGNRVAFYCCLTFSIFVKLGGPTFSATDREYILISYINYAKPNQL